MDTAPPLASRPPLGSSADDGAVRSWGLAIDGAYSASLMWRSLARLFPPATAATVDNRTEERATTPAAAPPPAPPRRLSEAKIIREKQGRAAAGPVDHAELAGPLAAPPPARNAGRKARRLAAAAAAGTDTTGGGS